MEHNEHPLLGIMVELPSAVEVAEELAQAADFLSIGSNDLVQYILAVDRTNSHISDLYLSHHPAVLRALNRVVQAARAQGKECSLCGDMAHDSRMLPFLLGIGLSTFSLDPVRIPQVQKVIQGLRMEEAQTKAARMLKMGRISEVKDFLSSLDGGPSRDAKKSSAQVTE